MSNEIHARVIMNQTRSSNYEVLVSYLQIRLSYYFSF